MVNSQQNRDFVVGAVDIGGTKILIGLVDSDNSVIASSSFKTIVESQAGSSAGVKSSDIIIEKLQCMLSQHTPSKKLKHVGIACTGPVDPIIGTVENPYTLEGWDHFNIKEYISDKLDVPVYLDNDVNGALLGEIKQKSLEDKSVLMITFGTGIGVAYYNGESLYKTSGRFHPEMGHQIISETGEMCYCGNVGCFESLCSGTAINRRSQSLGYFDFDQLLLESKKNEKAAQDFIKTVSNQYRNGIWNLLTIFKPQVLILGGGLVNNHFDFLKQILIENLGNAVDFVGQFTIERALGGAKGVLVGASILKN